MQGDPDQLRRVAILMTCHNRRESTLECLRSLRDQTNTMGYELSVHLTDDGSSDRRSGR